jgi:hypothetical protein
MDVESIPLVIEKGLGDGEEVLDNLGLDDVDEYEFSTAVT